MNQLNVNTNKGAANPSPMFSSIWVALYCLLRDGWASEAVVSAPVLDLKGANPTKHH